MQYAKIKRFFFSPIGQHLYTVMTYTYSILKHQTHSGPILNRLISRIFLLLLLSAPVSSAETDLLAKQYIAMARQGDLTQASVLFERLKSPGGSRLDHDLAAKFKHRFVLQDEPYLAQSGNEFVDELLKLYTTYWTRSLLSELPFDEGRTRLTSQVHSLLSTNGYHKTLEENDDAMSALDIALHQQGVFYDRSLASPWYDLLLWQS